MKIDRFVKVTLVLIVLLLALNCAKDINPSSNSGSSNTLSNNSVNNSGSRNSTTSSNNSGGKNTNNASITNTNSEAQQIHTAKDDSRVGIATPLQNAKTISFDELVSTFEESTNIVAAEARIKEIFGNQRVIVKNVPVWRVTKNEEGEILIQANTFGTPFFAVVFLVSEDKINSVMSIEGSLDPSDVNNIKNLSTGQKSYLKLHKPA